MKGLILRVCFFVFLLLIFSVKKTSAQLTASITSITNVTCNSFSNGSATVTQSGGTGPYTFAWAPSGGSNAFAGGLLAGSYICTVTDQFDLSTTTASVVITQPPPININISHINPSCFGGCNGSATATLSGGVAPYSYQWVPAFQTTQTANGLCAGIYTLTVTDAVGCINSNTVIIGQPPLLNININLNNSTCGQSNGWAQAVVSGGTAPYSYNWTPSVGIGASANNIPAGNYTVTVYDANGCSNSYSFSITNISGPISLSFNSTLATCNQSNGLAAVLPSGGSLPYTFAWSNSGTNDTIFNLAAGIYSVIVTDLNGCQASGQTAINNSGGPAISFLNVNNTTCYSSNNGSATVSVNSNAPPFVCLWNTSPIQHTFTAINLPSGNWLCTVTDSSNCQTTDSVTIFQPPQFYLGSQILYHGNCSAGGVARAWASGGILPYSYLWSNGSTNDTAVGIPIGNAFVIVTDNTGCSVQHNFGMTSSSNSVISGRVYEDVNGNCIYDVGDFPIANQGIYISPWNIWASTNVNGEYSRSSNISGTQTISTWGNFSTPNTSALCPVNSSQNITITGFCDTVSNVDFSRQTIPGIQDLRVSMTTWLPHLAMPQWVNIHYYNVGSVAVSNCSLTLVYDTILGFINATVSPFSNQPGQLVWQLGTLQPGQNGIIIVNLQVPNIPIGYIGRPLFYNATINPIFGDNTPPDNCDNELRRIVASHDPNEKIIYTHGLDSLNNISPSDTLLSYTIFFQNTGNDTAFNIYVEDTLSPYLDPATINLGVSSHPYTFEMYGNGIMRFNFYNIMLPDSNHNESLSNGFVKYKVKVRPGLLLGTTIDNTAFIYFDFNPAVVTNTTSNTILWGSPLNVIVNNFENISAFPNPFDESITLTLPGNLKTKNCDITLTDVQGRIVLTQKSQNTNSIIIHRGQLEAGIYFCTIRCDGEIIGNKKLVIK